MHRFVRSLCVTFGCFAVLISGSLPSWGRSTDSLDSLFQSQWIVKVDGEVRDRKLRLVSKPVESSPSVYQLTGMYGYVDGPQKSVVVTLTVVEGKRSLSFDTPAASGVSVDQVTPNQFSGNFVNAKGKRKSVTMNLLEGDLSPQAPQSIISENQQGEVRASQRSIHLVWMGGNDCPPCVHWRALELPKLKQSAEFSSIRFSYVIKGIAGSVPPLVFLPDEVKGFKSILDEASNGGRGSPQAALIVDGVVYDYFFGTRSAGDIERMILSVRTGAPYPYKRCVKMHRMGGTCIQFG